MLAAANFVYIFSSDNDVMPPVKLPLHALCTEDLGFAAQELEELTLTRILTLTSAAGVDRGLTRTRTLILTLTSPNPHSNPMLSLLACAGADRGRCRAVRRALAPPHLTEWLSVPLGFTTLTLTLLALALTTNPREANPLTRCAELTPLFEWAFALVPAEATLQDLSSVPKPQPYPDQP